MLRPIITSAFVLLGTASIQADEWLLTYSATEETLIESPKGDAPPRAEMRSYTQTVALADHYLVVQDGRQKLVRDFSRRRFVVLNLARNTYDEWSLFSLVDFLEVELANRNALGAAGRAANIDQMTSMFDRFDNETALHLESRANPHNPPKPVIEYTKLDDGAEFRHHDQTVVRFTASDTALPAELRRRFVNHLAYSCAIHPEIRRALADEKTVPQELVFTWRNLNKECRTYRRAFDQSSKAASEQSLVANATIDRTGLKRAYMLELQRANHLDRLGKITEAKECYLTVVRANPFHAGALHDLGMLLARSWDHPKAWLCWDTARRLYPEHFMLKDVVEREQQLLTRYPEFF